ncbi:MAG TPA: hypothetical protein VGO58_04500 [Chitinophagaceae bacterium]|jgi:hypothetical protein|nr:hypothetical protein [Chitinophagaceae bacterium]
MNRVFYLSFICFAVLVTACNLEKDKETDPDRIYFDYQVTGEEGNDNLTILLQYRDGGEDEDAISTGSSTSVTLDGEMIPPDSTRSGGIFYEMHKPIDAFTGKHQIVFTGPGKKEYREEFSFQPVRLLTVLPDTIHRADLVFEFEGLSGGTPTEETEGSIRVLLTDTSFINDGINHLEKAKDGRIVIPVTDLDRLANGPVQLVFTREIQRPVRKGTDEGGRLLITYTLKREFFLTD